jgi:hypothetical protein
MPCWPRFRQEQEQDSHTDESSFHQARLEAAPYRSALNWDGDCGNSGTANGHYGAPVENRHEKVGE